MRIYKSQFPGQDQYGQYPQGTIENCCGPNPTSPYCAFVSCLGSTASRPVSAADVKAEAEKQKQWIFIIAAIVVAYFIFKK